jgi:hypothetical protein
MFVNSLISDDSTQSAEGELTWAQIQRAIEGLDGQRISEVSIAKRGTESHMSVSGGGGYYLVSATMDNDIFYDLVNPTGDPAKTVRIVSGGQPVTVGMNETAELETALQVARSFAESGIIDPGSSWSRNPPE